MLDYCFCFVFLKHSLMILKEIHRHTMGAFPARNCHPHSTPTPGAEFKPASSCRNDATLEKALAFSVHEGWQLPAPSLGRHTGLAF